MSVTPTLMILGRPVSFTFTERCRIEGCRSPLHPGPCKGWRPKKATIDRGPVKKVAPAKAAPKKAAVKKAVPQGVQRGADKQATDAARAAEAKRLTSKAKHQGVPMDTVVGMFEEAAKQPGWGFDRKLMRATLKTPQGSATVEMVPQGYRAQIRRTGQPAEVKLFKDIGSAFTHASSRTRFGGPRS